jgi:hypothetical protein
METESLTYEQIWGVPVDEQPDQDPQRNFFDEQQQIDELSGGEGGKDYERITM